MHRETRTRSHPPSSPSARRGPCLESKRIFMDATPSKISALVLALSLSGTIARAQTEPAKLAASARFDLSASAEVGTLENGQVVAGNGSIQRPNWMPADRRSTAYTANFPVTRLGWRELVIRFTP